MGATPEKAAKGGSKKKKKCASCDGADKAEPKKYDTAEDAAVDKMKEYNPKSVAENREYGGWINRNEDGTFSPGQTVKGSVDGLSNMPDQGPNGAAWWHTHG